MKFFIIIGVVVTFAFPCFAIDGGTSVGNGGGGVKCPGKPIEFYDLYEARQDNGWTEFVQFGSSVQDHVHLYLNKLETVLTEGHSFVRVMKDQITFLSLTMTFVDGPIATSQDFGVTDLLPPECHLMQVALRGHGLASGHLLIDRAFWNETSDAHRALLLIHEAAHHWFRDREPSITGSHPVRQLVAILATSGAVLDAEKKKMALDIIDGL